MGKHLGMRKDQMYHNTAINKCTSLQFYPCQLVECQFTVALNSETKCTDQIRLKLFPVYRVVGH